MSYDLVPDLHWQYETTSQLKDNSEMSPNDQNGSLQEMNAQHFEYRTIAINSNGLLRLDSVPAVQQDLGISRVGDITARGPQSTGVDPRFQNAFDWSQSSQAAIQNSENCQTPEQTVPTLLSADERKRLAVRKSREKRKWENEQIKDSLKAAEDCNKNLKSEVQNLQKKLKQDDRQIAILKNQLQIAGVQATEDAKEKMALQGFLIGAADINDSLLRENDLLKEKLARKDNEVESLKSNIDQLTNQLVLTEYILSEYQSTNDPQV